MEEHQVPQSTVSQPSTSGNQLVCVPSAGISQPTASSTTPVRRKGKFMQGLEKAANHNPELKKLMQTAPKTQTQNVIVSISVLFQWLIIGSTCILKDIKIVCGLWARFDEI